MDFECSVIQDLVTKAMTNMTGDTNPSATSFRGLAEFRIGGMIINRLMEEEAKKSTNIDSLPGGNLEGNTADALVVDTIE